MQRVESCLNEAERLASERSRARPRRYDHLMSAIERQWLELAAQRLALLENSDMAAVTPLPFDTPWSARPPAGSRPTLVAETEAGQPRRAVSLKCVGPTGATVARGLLRYRDVADLRAAAELYPAAFVFEAWDDHQRRCIARLQRIDDELYEIEPGWPPILLPTPRRAAPRPHAPARPASRPPLIRRVSAASSAPRAAG